MHAYIGQDVPGDFIQRGTVVYNKDKMWDAVELSVDMALKNPEYRQVFSSTKL